MALSRGPSFHKMLGRCGKRLKNLRDCLKDGKVDQKAFDYLRKTYPLRREWAAHGGPKA